MACAPELDEKGQSNTRAQPVFCLMQARLMESLMTFMQGGGRKIDKWTAQHRTALVAFDTPTDSAQAFANANTLAELHALE